MIKKEKNMEKKQTKKVDNKKVKAPKADVKKNEEPKKEIKLDSKVKVKTKKKKSESSKVGYYVTMGIFIAITITLYGLSNYIFEETSVFNRELTGNGFINSLYMKIPALLKTIQIITIAWVVTVLVRLFLTKVLAKCNDCQAAKQFYQILDCHHSNYVGIKRMGRRHGDTSCKCRNFEFGCRAWSTKPHFRHYRWLLYCV